MKPLYLKLVDQIKQTVDNFKNNKSHTSNNKRLTIFVIWLIVLIGVIFHGLSS